MDDGWDVVSQPMEEEPDGAASGSGAAPIGGPPDGVRVIRQLNPEAAAASSAAGQAGGSVLIPVKQEPTEEDERPRGWLTPGC